jgi:hypothetical protein
LIGLEPILTVILAGVILRERVNPRIAGAMLLGLAGVWILSNPSAGGDEAAGNRLWGNLLFLGSLLCEATVTISGGRLAKLYSPLPTIAAMKAFGLLAAAIFYGPVVAATSPSSFGGEEWTSRWSTSLCCRRYSPIAPGIGQLRGPRSIRLRRRFMHSRLWARSWGGCFSAKRWGRGLGPAEH